MNLFFKKSTIGSPISGSLISLKEVADESFAKELIGIGVAIIPESDLFYSPVDGEIVAITPTKHAIAIQSDDGMQILIHIGIDSFNKCIDCFSLKIEVGQKVKKGDLIAEVNFKMLKDLGVDITTPILVLNKERFRKIVMSKSAVVHNGDWIIKYET